jgi:anti-sigma factor RsiW
MPVNGERTTGRACLSDDELAEYLDGVLAPEDRRRVEEHLASCDECRTIVADTVIALGAIELEEAQRAPQQPEGQARGTLEMPAPGPEMREARGTIPFPTPSAGGTGGGGGAAPSTEGGASTGSKSRKTWPALGLLAAAAVLAFIARDPILNLLGFGEARARADAATALIAAAAEQRTFEPRLTGGFRHAPLQGVTRSGDPRGFRLTPDVTIATARVSQLAARDTSVDAQALLGEALLIAGDLDPAVGALEAARLREPKRADILSNLSAAYYVRAERTGRVEDYSHAFETASAAVTLTPTSPEARFNLALATERTQPPDEARKAWETYLQQDPASPWSEEARRHLTNLPH